MLNIERPTSNAQRPMLKKGEQARPKIRPGPVVEFIPGDRNSLFRVSVCGTRRRAGGCRLLFMSACAQTQSPGQNCNDHDRFQKFQSTSPPFSASCFASLGKELHGSNAFFAIFGCAQLTNRELRPGYPRPQDRIIRSHRRCASGCNRGCPVCRFCLRAWFRECK